VSLLKKKILGLRLRSWGVILLTLPIVVWGGLNILFSTFLGTGLLERKVEAYCGFPCEIESVTWSPWAGCQVRDFVLNAPEGGTQDGRVLEVGKVAIDLSWSSLFERKKRWDRIVVEDVHGEVSIELLRDLMTKYKKVAPRWVETTSPAEVASNSGASAPEVENDPGGSKPQSSGSKVEGEAVKNEPKPVPKDSFEGVVVFRNVNLNLFSTTYPDASVVVENVEGELPIWGATREGEVVVERLKICDQFEECHLNFPVVWDSSRLLMDAHPMKLFGLDTEISAVLHFTRELSFGFQVDLPDQHADLSFIVKEYQKTPIELQHLTGRNLMQGSLSNIGNISASSVTYFKQGVLFDLRDRSRTEFSSGVLKLRANTGGVILSEARAVGDEDALLGNGFLTSTGEAAMTLRIVSSPEMARSHESRVNRLAPVFDFYFSPLVTPDREFRDVRIEWREGQLVADLAKERGFVPLLPTVKAVFGK